MTTAYAPTGGSFLIDHTTLLCLRFLCIVTSICPADTCIAMHIRYHSSSDTKSSVNKHGPSTVTGCATAISPSSIDGGATESVSWMVWGS